MDVPWAAAGTVTVTNGGDVFKEADLIPPSATQPVTEQQASGLPYASVSILSLNAVDGTSIYDDTTWIMGEISNTGNANAYDVTISGLLKDAQGSIMGSGSATIQCLPPGRTVGYSIIVRDPQLYVAAEVSGIFDLTSYRTYWELPTSNESLRAVESSYSGTSYRYAGIASNNTPTTLEFSKLHVWFLDASGTVVSGMGSYVNDYTYLDPSTVPSGGWVGFDEESGSPRYNPAAGSIVTAKAFTYGSE